MFCDNCGTELDRGQAYCSKCGMPVVQAPPVSPYQPMPSPMPRQRNTVPVLVTACTVLAMVLLGLGLVASGVVQINSSPDTTTEQVMAKTTASSNSGSSTTTSSTDTDTSSPSASQVVVVQENKTQVEETKSTTPTEKEIVYVPVPTETEQPAPSNSGATNSGYVLPDSNSRYYSASELSGLSNWDLYLARNEIYARHGRGFVRDDLQAYFNNCTWYTRRIDPEDFDDSVLNDCEITNALTMRSIEESRGSPYL